MATIIDSLTVSLGLDPKEFEAGQKKASEAFVKTRKEAEVQGKKIEQSAEGMSNSFAAVTRRVLELYAAFLGARGLQEFISSVITGDAALGRFSKNLGLSAQYVSAWEMAVERVGGSASDATGMMERLGKSLYDLRYNGVMGKELFQLSAAAHMHIPTDKGLPAYLNATAEALQKVYRTNPSRAHYLAEGMGISASDFQVMVQHGGQTNNYIDSLKKLAPTQSAIKAAQDLQKAWNGLQQQAQSLANVIVRTLGPQVAVLLKQMAAWVSKNHDWLQSKIVDAVKQFAAAIGSIDWKSVGKGIEVFTSAAVTIAHAFGGAAHMTNMLFDLWLGSKFLKVLANVRTLGAAQMAEGAAGGVRGGGRLGGGLLGWLGLGGMIGLGMSKLPSQDELKKRQEGWSRWLHKNIPGASWWDNNVAAKPSSAKPTSAEQTSGAQQSYDFWRSKGLNKYAALAMVGNEQGESGFNPNAVGDGGAAHGSFQWHKNRRQDILAGTGIDVSNPKTTHQQMLEAAYWEMTQGNDAGARAAWKALKGAKSVQQGIHAAVNDFERPANRGSAAQTRLGYAAAMSQKLNLNYGAKSVAPLMHPGQSIGGGNITIGNLVVHSAAKDAPGIANDIHAEIKNQRKTSASNNGLF